MAGVSPFDGAAGVWARAAWETPARVAISRMDMRPVAAAAPPGRPVVRLGKARSRV